MYIIKPLIIKSKQRRSNLAIRNECDILMSCVTNTLFRSSSEAGEMACIYLRCLLLLLLTWFNFNRSMDLKIKMFAEGWVVYPRTSGSPEPTWHEAHSTGYPQCWAVHAPAIPHQCPSAWHREDHTPATWRLTRRTWVAPEMKSDWSNVSLQHTYRMEALTQVLSS